MTKEIDKAKSDTDAEALVSRALAVNESRRHDLPRTRLVAFVRKRLKIDAKWFDKHRLVFVTYSDERPDIVSQSVISLMEKYADADSYVMCRKHPNGKSMVFSDGYADELFGKSEVKTDKKFIMTVGDETVNYCKIVYPLRRKLKCFGGERLKDAIVKIDEERKRRTERISQMNRIKRAKRKKKK